MDELQDLIKYFDESIIGRFYQFLNVVKLFEMQMPNECQGLIEWNNDQLIIKKAKQLSKIGLQIIQGSNFYSMVSQLGLFGFDIRTLYHENLNEVMVVRHPDITSQSTMKEWARVWLKQRIQKYFDKSAMGVLFYELRLAQSQIAQWAFDRFCKRQYIVIKSVERFNNLCSRLNDQQKGFPSLRRVNFNIYDPDNNLLNGQDRAAIYHRLIEKKSTQLKFQSNYEKLKKIDRGNRKRKDDVDSPKKEKQLQHTYRKKVSKCKRSKNDSEVITIGYKRARRVSDTKAQRHLKKYSGEVVEHADNLMCQVVSFNLRYPETFEQFQHLVEIIKSLKDIGHFYHSMFEVQASQQSSDEYVPSWRN